MKKLSALFLVFILCSCVYAGNNDVFPERNEFIELFNSYPIDFYDETPEALVKTEYITENNFKNNVVLTAFTGFTVVDTKTYRRDFYRSDYLKPNVNGVLNCGSVPVEYGRNETLRALGLVVVDDVEYVLVQTKLKDFVALVNKKGEFYNRIGQIRNKRLVLLDTDFVPYPANLRLFPVTTSRTVQTEPVKGFDVKYEGVKLDQMLFTVLDYSKSQGDSGSFVNIRFPNQPGLIDINGIGIKVLSADKNKLDYIILNK